MHHLRFSSKFLSKLNCFVLLLIFAAFSPTVLASDSETDNKKSGSEASASDSESENGDESDQGSKGLDLETVIKDTAPELLKAHLIDYSNKKGQNYLHLIKLDQFDLFADSVGDDVAVGYMLLQQDSEDMRPLERFANEDTINPRFIQIVTAQRNAENDTLLMAFSMRDEDPLEILSTLAGKGVTIDQKDIYGNTAESIFDDYLKYGCYSYNMVSKNPNMTRYKSQLLSNALWQDILKDQYSLYMRKLTGSQGSTIDPYDFAAIALEVVDKQKPQTGVHTAFLLMEDSSTDADRVKANELWRGFFKAHDTLLSKKDAEKTQNLPLSGRILRVVSEHQYRPELQDATVQLITGTSRFGTTFKKATEEEAETYVWSIRNYVEQLLSNDPDNDFGTNVSHLKTAFQRKSFKEVTEDQMRRLRRHQLKCTVVALYSLNELYDQHSSTPRKQKLGDTKVFDLIDSTLADWSKEASINSRALFANVQDHLRPDSKALDFED